MNLLAGDSHAIARYDEVVRIKLASYIAGKVNVLLWYNHAFPDTILYKAMQILCTAFLSTYFYNQ